MTFRKIPGTLRNAKWVLMRQKNGPGIQKRLPVPFLPPSRVLARNAMVTQASIQSLIDSARESAKTYIGWG